MVAANFLAGVQTKLNLTQREYFFVLSHVRAQKTPPSLRSKFLFDPAAQGPIKGECRCVAPWTLCSYWCVGLGTRAFQKGPSCLRGWGLQPKPQGGSKLFSYVIEGGDPKLLPLLRREWVSNPPPLPRLFPNPPPQI